MFEKTKSFFAFILNKLSFGHFFKPKPILLDDPYSRAVREYQKGMLDMLRRHKHIIEKENKKFDKTISFELPKRSTDKE